MPRSTNLSVATMGIDIGKNSFHVVGLDQRGAIVVRQRWRRSHIRARLAHMSPCMGLSMSSTNFEQWHLFSFLSYPFVRPPAEPILSSRPGGSHGRRAQGRVKDGRRSSRSTTRRHFQAHSLTDPSTVAGLGASGLAGRRHFASSKQRQDDLRRACPGWARRSRATSLYSADPRGSKP